MWVSATLLTLVFFLISLGFGLFILALSSTALIKQSGLTRLQLLALGFTTGSIVSGIFLQLLSLASRNPSIDLGVLSLVSLAGFLMTRNLWLPGREDRTEIMIWAAVSLPMALITWWWTFGAFSNFPFADIGADVHWMKIAQEYADTGILNPYASQSYTDFRSALAGALSGTFGLDLLQFQWVYRYFSILCLMVFFYAFSQDIFPDRRRKWFAFLFSAAGNTLGLLTNGSLAVASSLVFLGVLLKPALATDRQNLSSLKVLIVVCGAILSLLFAYYLNNNALMSALLVAGLLFFNVLTRMGGAAKQLAGNSFVSIIWPIALLLAHRGAYLFIPAAISAWVLYVVVFSAVSRDRSPLLRTFWGLSFLLPVICLTILGFIAAEYFGYLPPMNSNRLFSYITFLVVGKSIEAGDDIILGAGPDVASIEMGRALGPMFAVGIALMMAWWCATHPPARLRQFVNSASQSRNVALLIWSWVAGCALCIVVLSGFPFLYRIVFVIAGLFTISATELFFQLFVEPVPAPVKRARLVAAIASAALAVLAVLYCFGWPSKLRYGGYEPMLRPFEIVSLALVLLFAALTFARSRKMQILGIAVVISLGVAADRSGVSVIFKPYSYGPLPERSTAISHYGQSDLNTVHWLRDNMPLAIVISDPSSLGLAQAIVGMPSVFLFSNLDTVNDAVARQAKAVLSAMMESNPSGEEKALKVCTTLAPLTFSLNQEAETRIQRSTPSAGIFKPVRPVEQKDLQELSSAAIPHSVDDVIRSTTAPRTEEGKWNIVAIINPRTIAWTHLGTGARLPYFPIDEPLNQDEIGALRSGPFRVLFSDGQNAIVLIDCAAAITDPAGKAF